MSFLSKLWNWNSQITWKNFQGNPLLYRVAQNTKEIIIQKSKVRFEQRGKELLLHFVSTDNGPVDRFFAGLHTEMNVYAFNNDTDLESLSFCVQWTPQKEQMTYNSLRFGCQFKNKAQAENFARILNVLCEELNGGKPVQPRNIVNPSDVMQVEYEQTSAQTQSRLHQILLQQAEDQTTKMANTCKLYTILPSKTSLILEHGVFVIQSSQPFKFSFFVLNSDSEVVAQHEITPTMTYEINVNKGELKWMDVSTKPSSVYRVVFDKYEVTINVQFAIAECLYEGNTKRNLRSTIEQQDRNAVILMQQQAPIKSKSSKKLLQVMEEQDQIIYTYESSTKKKKNGSSSKKKIEEPNAQKLIFQARMTDRAFVSNGDYVDVYKIGNNEIINAISSHRIIGVHGDTVTPTKMVMHDLDSKAVISNSQGKLVYTDLNTFQAIQQLNTPNKTNIVDFCAENKLAELGEFNNFIGVTENCIYKFDPKLKKGSGTVMKQYGSNPHFSSMAIREDGSYALGSSQGDIRLYDKRFPGSAASKYPAFGDPVLHLESTKDGEWLLATFQDYILLLPTFTNDGVDLYNPGSEINDRPSPRRLTVKNEHKKYSKTQIFKLVHAKFDQTKSQHEKFIISGFGEYVIVWSLQNVIAGNSNYTVIIQQSSSQRQAESLMMSTLNSMTAKESLPPQTVMFTLKRIQQNDHFLRFNSHENNSYFKRQQQQLIYQSKVLILKLLSRKFHQSLMISMQLSKYKQSQRSHHNSSHKKQSLAQTRDLPQSHVYSQYSYNPSYHPSESSSYQQTPKSKIALLNQKLIQQADIYNQRRGKSINGSYVTSRSRQRSYKPFNPIDPVITRFNNEQEIIRKKNAVTKYKMTSNTRQSSKQKIKLSLPPRSPFVVSEYLHSSARSKQQKDGYKSTAHSHTKKGVQQIVFITDESDNQIESESQNQYKSTKGKYQTKHSNEDYFNNQINVNHHMTLNSNGFKNPQIFRAGSGFKTPSFNNFEQPILSPMQVIQQGSPYSYSANISAPKYTPLQKHQQYQQYNQHQKNEQRYPSYSTFEQPLKQKVKLANKKPIYLSAFIVTIIALFLLYEIIK